MAVIKFDVSASDPGEAKGGALQVPKRGVKVVKIVSITDRRSKGKDDLEVKAVIAQGDNKHYPYWDYLNFGEASVWKMDQFLQAIGVATGSKRTGQFDPTKQINKLVKVDTRVETDEDGEPVRSRIRAWLGLADEVDDETDVDETDDSSDDDEADDDGGDEDETAADDSEPDDDYDDWEVSDLRAELKDKGLDTKGGKPALIARLREADNATDEGTAGEDDYDDWDVADLKAELEERGLKAAGRKSTLIEKLREDDTKGSAFDS